MKKIFFFSFFEVVKIKMPRVEVVFVLVTAGIGHDGYICLILMNNLYGETLRVQTLQFWDCFTKYI